MAVTHTELSELSEQGLVESCHAGDHEAFDRIVRRYQPGLLAHARRRLGSQQAAEDAVQETLLRAYRALPRFNGEYRLGNWLHRILRNVCVDEANRHRRRLALVDRLSATDPPCAHEAVEQTVVARDRSAVVRALDELPESYRRAFVLRAVDELPYDEVARACEISEENARARVSRARTVLRRTTARLGSFAAMVGFDFRRGRAQVADAAVPTASTAQAAPAVGQAAASTAQAAPAVSHAAPAVSQAAPAVSQAVSQVVAGPSPLAIQLTAAAHDFAPAAGAASRAIAVLASAAAVVLPAALSPDRDDTTEARSEAAQSAEVVEVELAAGGSTPGEVPVTTEAPTSTTVAPATERAPQVTASDLAVQADDQGWTVSGRLTVDTGSAVYEGTIEPYSRLTLAPADASDPARPRPFEITAAVTLDDGRAVNFRLTGSAVLVVPEPEGGAEDPADGGVTTTTAPPAVASDGAGEPVVTTSTTAVDDGTTPPPDVVTTTTTAPPATDPSSSPSESPSGPAPSVERFELSGMFAAEGADVGVLAGGSFYGLFVISDGGGDLQLSLSSIAS